MIKLTLIACIKCFTFVACFGWICCWLQASAICWLQCPVFVGCKSLYLLVARTCVYWLQVSLYLLVARTCICWLQVSLYLLVACTCICWLQAPVFVGCMLSLFVGLTSASVFSRSLLLVGHCCWSHSVVLAFLLFGVLLFIRKSIFFGSPNLGQINVIFGPKLTQSAPVAAYNPPKLQFDVLFFMYTKEKIDRNIFSYASSSTPHPCQ